MSTGFSPAAHIESSWLEQKNLLIKAEKELRRRWGLGVGMGMRMVWMVWMVLLPRVRRSGETSTV